MSSITVDRPGELMATIHGVVKTFAGRGLRVGAAAPANGEKR